MLPQPPGPNFHTFTAIARCPKTKRLGIATATRSLAVGSRVPFVQPRLGAVAIMAIADKRLGLMAQRLLQTGYKAQGVIEQLVIGDPYHEYRQLGVIDDDGFAAARTGTQNRDWAGHHVGENFIALGNVLQGEHILTAIEDGYNANPDDEIEDRLMAAIEAGRDAGGQKGGQRSAAILVYEDKEYARVDLRVDAHEEPVGEMRRVFDFYKPAIEYYVHRQVDARVEPLSEAVPVEGY
ncbi:MAG: DUF1028 domain-containing protein [Rhodospirillaceae bacterium]|jgi:uncharacterized Ntn-hydrolase superfamily protein|nr:DUF1028 domain-containing protein [Rhodospirillaceae bacterium]MBT3491952.1 DUF1028 domain-containing protein [Rhodospirillaceae bacterium]MBT3782048.1 DUF1028 domain-containing protein [Rhodospirillaceae bacterium]MBT3977480.1 DUF1028 domain-containing protein [Rhodospirillaceae bacterium]MBT4171386.1 DUF1028 domain-containing protein [Rhodospirillaceae bacterium]